MYCFRLKKRMDLDSEGLKKRREKYPNIRKNYIDPRDFWVIRNYAILNQSLPFLKNKLIETGVVLKLVSDPWFSFELHGVSGLPRELDRDGRSIIDFQL